MPEIRPAPVLSLAILCASTAADQPVPEPPKGDAAPEFTAANLMTHDKVKLSSEQGKLVFLTFWASWCPPCPQELPVLAADHGCRAGGCCSCAVVSRNSAAGAWRSAPPSPCGSGCRATQSSVLP